MDGQTTRKEMVELALKSDFLKHCTALLFESKHGHFGNYSSVINHVGFRV